MLVTISYIKSRFLKYSNKVQDISNIKLFILYIIAYIRCKCTIKDFFNYKFYLLNGRGQRLFVTGRAFNRLYDRINDPVSAAIMNNKEETLVKYEKFISRNWCGVAYNNALENYREFIENNTQGIVKPMNSSGGTGVRIVDLKKEHYTAETLQKKCLEQQLLIEQIIIQHERMKELHPSSINSIRVVTENGVIIGAALRCGVGGSDVDNACSGGLFAQVDIQEGIVISKAMNYEGEQVIKHPDTNVVFPGFIIPMWDDVVDFIKDAVNVLPDIPITGFDIAISPEGPVLIEVNERPDLPLIQQMQTIQIEQSILREH